MSNCSDSIKTINQWSEDVTDGKIKNLLSIDDIHENCGVILLNVIYFKGNWKHKFDKHCTKLKPFFLNKTTALEVPTMYIRERFLYKYISELHVQYVAIPYENEDLVMLIILPKETDDLASIEENLAHVKPTLENDFKYRDIGLSLPKFKVETKIDLNDHLIKLGMIEMFKNDANFNGISTSPLKVETIRQAAFIEVNEDGTEAAAVTEITEVLVSRPRQVKVVRPFLYKILYKNTTIISGRIMNPLIN